MENQEDIAQNSLEGSEIEEFPVVPEPPAPADSLEQDAQRGIYAPYRTNQDDSGFEGGASEPEDPERSEFIRKAASDLKTTRTYLIAAGICGPFSLIFGGILLGTVGLIFAILAYRKLRPYYARDDELGMQVRRIRMYVVLAMVICASCIIANLVFAIMYYPTLEQMFSSSLSSGSGSTGSSTGTGTSSTWG